MTKRDDAAELEKMRQYIKSTKPSEYNHRYTMRSGQLVALAQMAIDGDSFKAVMLAFDYGLASGLRMGRREARKAVSDGSQRQESAVKWDRLARLTPEDIRKKEATK